MSFETQSNHEVKSFPISRLLQSRQNLIHLGSSIPVVLANYRIKEHWFGTPTVGERLDTMEVCSQFETLGQHLKLNSLVVEPRDSIAVNASDAQIISRLLIG